MTTVNSYNYTKETIERICEKLDDYEESILDFMLDLMLEYLDDNKNDFSLSSKDMEYIKYGK